MELWLSHLLLSRKNILGIGDSQRSYEDDSNFFRSQLFHNRHVVIPA